MPEEQFKRNIAYKHRIGDLLDGKVVFDLDKFKFLELPGEKHVSRVNIIANIIEKYIQDDEKKFASITLDDASGQIKIKSFGDDIHKIEKFEQGDTVLVIGVLRQWNNELYILPEIVKKRSPTYLFIRKLELDAEKPKSLAPEELNSLREKLLDKVKTQEANGGAEVESLILELKSSPQVINQEIKKLLEEGIIYEPRPGKVRYLG